MGLATLGVMLILAAALLPRMLKPAGGKAPAWAGIAQVVGALLIVGGVLSSGFVVVPAGHRGVLLRFGAVQGILNEGPHIIVPSVNTVQLIEVRTQKEEAQSSAASRDLQTVTANIALNFHIDPAAVGTLYRNVGLEYRTRIIDPAVQESLKVVTARYTAEELIRLRDKVKTEVQDEMAKRLGRYSIVVEPSGVSLTNFLFSEEFNRAIEAKQVAQQTAEKQKYILQQAQLEAQTAITKAKGLAEANRINAGALQSQGGKLVLAKEWIEKWDGKLPMVQGSGSQILDLRSLMPDLGTSARP